MVAVVVAMVVVVEVDRLDCCTTLRVKSYRRWFNNCCDYELMLMHGMVRALHALHCGKLHFRGTPQLQRCLFRLLRMSMFALGQDRRPASLDSQHCLWPEKGVKATWCNCSLLLGRSDVTGCSVDSTH